MSEHWPEFGSDQPNVEPEATGSSSANGAHPEEAVAVAEGAAEDAVAAESGTADGSPAVAEVTDESAISEAADDAAVASQATETAVAADAADAGSDDGATVAATADDGPAVEATADDGVAVAAADEGSAAQASAEEGPELLVELARVMQETVARQRIRIVEDAERRRLAHVEQVRAREASEADRMRELAAEDMKAIEAWADGERQRIQLERHRRATELHEDLDMSLAEHRAKIEREIEGVDKAIAAYRAEVDAFFEGLDRETDVVQIAQHAAWRPVFPTLDAIAEPVAVPAAETPTAEQSTTDVPPSGSDDNGASGTGAGTSEPTVVGVMDPAAPAEPAESWAATPEASPEPVPVEASGDADQGGEAHEPAEPVVATAGASHSAVSSLFESVQVLRPMAWLRRDANGGDRPNQ